MLLARDFKQLTRSGVFSCVCHSTTRAIIYNDHNIILHSNIAAVIVHFVVIVPQN